jgi:hypothetical protein
MKNITSNFIISFLILTSASFSSENNFDKRFELINEKNCSSYSFNAPNKYNCPMHHDRWKEVNCNSLQSLNQFKCPEGYNSWKLQQRQQQNNKKIIGKHMLDNKKWTTLEQKRIYQSWAGTY